MDAWANIGRASLAPAWREILALARLEFVSKEWREALAFALRCCAACVLALYLAFFLQLDEPYWAGLAVWMVAQPTPGMAISKSIYRVIGTVVGCAMAVVLIAFFAQTPELFILALALWIGACTVASNLLRNFRAYGAVLAGYTAAIISLGTIDDPNQVFLIAMARGSATIIGIACAAVITSLFAPHRAREKTTAKIGQVLGRAASRAAMPFTCSVPERVAIGRPLVEDMIALDAEIDFAAAESAEFRIHAGSARSLLAHLFGMIAARRSLEDRLRRAGPVRDAETAALLDSAIQVLGDAPRKIGEDRSKELEEGIEELHSRVRAQTPEFKNLEIPQGVSCRIVLDRLDDMFRHYGRAVHDWTGLREGWKLEPSQRLDFHRDHRAAWINGARAAIAIIAAGTFWIATAWSSGASMLILASVACSLFSAAPHPDRAGTAFLQGGLLAAASAFICNFYVLQNITGFPLFALAISIFLIPGALAFYRPKTSLLGLAYCVNFLTICRPLNPMDYDMISFLNNAVATNMGVAFGVLAYKLFMPPDPQAARRYVVNRIRRGLRVISQREPIPPAWLWQTRMFDRVTRLNDPANPSGTHTDEWFEGGLGALDLGSEVLRLRALLKGEKLEAKTEAAARTVLKSFQEIIVQPDSTQETIQATGRAFQQSAASTGSEEKRAWLRVLGILQEMEAFFLEHPHFFKPVESKS
jgi:uncharacterized membrane protein YccC